MDIERCRNVECRRPFSVSEYQLGMPGTKDRESISCPHCHHSYERMSNGFFQTSKLSEAAEKEFCKAHPISA